MTLDKLTRRTSWPMSLGPPPGADRPLSPVGVTVEGAMRIERTRMWLGGRVIAIFGMAGIVLAAGTSGQAVAGDFGRLDTDCHGLKLKQASGLPSGLVHTYRFEGTCNLVSVHPSGPSVQRAFPARAQVTWNHSKRELVESFATLGTFEFGKRTRGGTLRSVYRCNEDPIVVTKGVACTGVAHKNETAIEPLSNPFLKLYRPITRGKTTLAEATAASRRSDGRGE